MISVNTKDIENILSIIEKGKKNVIIARNLVNYNSIFNASYTSKKIVTLLDDVMLSTGNIVKYIKKGKRKTNFVGISENEVCHVRPHGRNSRDTITLPVPDKLTGVTEYTKQCFWINNNYIREIFKEFNN